MLERLIRNWWVLALRGVLAIVFGVLAAFWPRMTLFTLVWLWGAYALVDGGFALAAAVRAAGREQPWMMLVLRGVVGVAAGIVAFVWTDITTFAMLYLMAGWAVVSGIFEIAAAVRLRQIIEGEWLIGFCNGVRRDWEAVKAGLSLPWSNGPVEGQVNRLKLIKRGMYGRAGFALLRGRVLPPLSPPG